MKTINLRTKCKITKLEPKDGIGGMAYCGFGLAIVLTIIAFFTGCASIDKAYVEADRMTYEAIGTEYVEYVNQDDNLREWEKTLRSENVKSWASRIAEAEEQ